MIDKLGICLPEILMYVVLKLMIVVYHFKSFYFRI